MPSLISPGAAAGSSVAVTEGDEDAGPVGFAPGPADGSPVGSVEGVPAGSVAGSPVGSVAGAATALTERVAGTSASPGAPLVVPTRGT